MKKNIPIKDFKPPIKQTLTLESIEKAIDQLYYEHLQLLKRVKDLEHAYIGDFIAPDSGEVIDLTGDSDCSDDEYDPDIASKKKKE